MLHRLNLWLGRKLNRFLLAVQVGMGHGTIFAHTELGIRLLDKDGNVLETRKEIRDKVVTTAYVNFIVDQHQTESSEIGDFKYHQCGLGVTAENITDTGIESDTGISPATGTQAEGASANIYKSVATMTMDTTEAITEHVLMSQSGAGTCMDRTKFSAINVESGNQIEFTFQITFSSGG